MSKRPKKDRLACPRCGCPHLPVYRTRHRNGKVERERYCRHCGQRVITKETAS